MDNRVLIITGDAVDADVLTKILGRASDGPFTVEMGPPIVRWTKPPARRRCRCHYGGSGAARQPRHRDLRPAFRGGAADPDHDPLSADDEALARSAVQRGAQGFLSKGHYESYLVPQSLRNIIQRKAVEEMAFIVKARAEVTLNSISDGRGRHRHVRLCRLLEQGGRNNDRIIAGGGAWPADRRGDADRQRHHAGIGRQSYRTGPETKSCHVSGGRNHPDPARWGGKWRSRTPPRPFTIRRTADRGGHGLPRHHRGPGGDHQNGPSGPT